MFEELLRKEKKRALSARRRPRLSRATPSEGRTDAQLEKETLLRRQGTARG